MLKQLDKYAICKALDCEYLMGANNGNNLCSKAICIYPGFIVAELLDEMGYEITKKTDNNEK